MKNPPTLFISHPYSFRVRYLTTIITLISLAGSVSAAQTNGRLLCSHEDGSDHVVDSSSHEAEAHDSCEHDEAAVQCLCSCTIDACEDVEISDSELEDLSSANSRLGKNAVDAIVARVAVEVLHFERIAQSTVAIPRKIPLLEDQSRRFAKIMQIRC